MWGGTVDDIPLGWVLCDGKTTLNDGTTVPNLVDYFIVGGSSYNSGNPSIVASGITTAAGAHTHNTSNKSQSFITQDSYWGCSYERESGYKNSGFSIKNAGDHTHNVNLDSTKDKNVKINTLNPDWYSLIFIIKT